MDTAGSRIRAARRARGMSLRALAEKVGVSASMLSLLETGRSRSSVPTLYAVVEALDMSLDELFADQSATRTTPAPPERDAPADANADVVIVRRSQGRRIEMESGVVWEQLGNRSVDGLGCMLVTYPPGAKSSDSGRFQRHTGWEFAHVTHGVLTCQVVFDEFTIGAGDSVSFDSSRPHLFENRGDVEVRAVWVILRSPAARGLSEHDHAALSAMALAQLADPS